MWHLCNFTSTSRRLFWSFIIADSVAPIEASTLSFQSPFPSFSWLEPHVPPLQPNEPPVEPPLDQLRFRSMEQLWDGMVRDILLCGSNVIVNGIQNFKEVNHLDGSYKSRSQFTPDALPYLKQTTGGWVVSIQPFNIRWDALSTKWKPVINTPNMMAVQTSKVKGGAAIALIVVSTSQNTLG